MKLYIASRFRNKQWINNWADTLPSKHSVISTWHGLADDMDGSHAEAVARDLKEITEADAVVIISHNCEAVPGGLYFEAGFAHALGKKLYLIGPAVNIFLEVLCQVPDYNFYAQINEPEVRG